MGTKKIKTVWQMKRGEVGYVVPWLKSMGADVSEKPSGTTDLKITRIFMGFKFGGFEDGGTYLYHYSKWHPHHWLKAVSISVAVVSLLFGSCYVLTTKTSWCQGWEVVPESEVREHAEKLGKDVLCCNDVKVYITGKGGYNRAYVAVVGCGKKVMLQCYSRSDSPDHSGCRQFSDVMPGNVLNVKHRSHGSGKFYTEWWELEP